MDLISGAIGLVVGAVIGATVGYKWISAELVVAKADLANIIAKVQPLIAGETAVVTPVAALAHAVAAVKTK